MKIGLKMKQKSPLFLYLHFRFIFKYALSLILWAFNHTVNLKLLADKFCYVSVFILVDILIWEVVSFIFFSTGLNILNIFLKIKKPSPAGFETLPTPLAWENLDPRGYRPTQPQSPSSIIYRCIILFVAAYTQWCNQDLVIQSSEHFNHGAKSVLVYVDVDQSFLLVAGRFDPPQLGLRWVLNHRAVENRS